MKPFSFAVILPALVLAGCASVPTGPRVMVLPGTGRSFTEFQASDAMCRQYASRVIGQTVNDPAIREAVVGTVVGAVAGAAIGGSHGAGVGAGTGLIVGSSSGAETSRLSGYEAQYRYDEAYVQCMYASGHRVPVPASVASSMTQYSGVVAPAPAPAAAAGKKAPSAEIPPPPPFAPPSSPPPDYVPPKSGSR
ncbi:MAG: hypothetical protein LBD67_06110 [Candidatus Accumulibacter sp.]|jgi:outer membrane lipoprotein SlyB|nr:hypothetical protein [Accumulibacter sp.]